jgi:clan AA aspartic protease
VITGSVSADREAVVRLQVQADNGASHDIDAVVDTGYTGFLTLPGALIAALGLQLRGRAQVVLGDGSIVFADVFVGSVIWDSQPRPIEVDLADTDPLVGMSLLYGSELRVEVIDGGSVTIEALP